VDAGGAIPFGRSFHHREGGLSVKKITVSAVFVFFCFAFAQSAFPHCEIPCGIYDDQMRIHMIRENITTIEKAMKQVVEMSGQSPVNYNQIVRWTMNKEEHAEQLQHIVYQYFMTQRIKPAESDKGEAYDTYVEQVTLLHQMLVEAMKTKQSTDLGHVEALRKLTDRFEKSYFGDKK
jgi:nickel superoxide dismutase